MHIIKRRLWRLWIKFRIALKFDNKRSNRSKRPNATKLDKSQSCAIDIAVKTMRHPLSKLYYDLETQECYIKREDAQVGVIYIFIEANNIKIINTVFGYDIPIGNDSEQYLTWIFRKEMAKRRSQFKNEAISKVDFSLHKVLDKINEKL